MRHERPSSDDGTERRDAGRGDAAADRTRDERELYGEPRHEVATGRDVATLYGEPQHETQQSEEDPDVLFARLRMESFAAPSASTSGESPAASATER